MASALRQDTRTERKRHFAKARAASVSKHSCPPPLMVLPLGMLIGQNVPNEKALAAAMPVWHRLMWLEQGSSRLQALGAAKQSARFWKQ